jgi:uncharacterized protein YgfB (UPF0149 family)
MSAPSLPDFDRAVRLSQGNLDLAEAAECHGLLCGLVCRDASRSVGDYLDHLEAMQLLVQPSGALGEIISELFDGTVRQMEDEELGFELWLPSDDEPLEERTIALAQWCSGFMAGLASAGPLDSLSEEGAEAIEDLQQIARAEISGPPGNAEELEEDEAAFVEIVEYVRVVALMMHEDFRGPVQGEAIH